MLHKDSTVAFEPSCCQISGQMMIGPTPSIKNGGDFVKVKSWAKSILRIASYFYASKSLSKVRGRAQNSAPLKFQSL